MTLTHWTKTPEFIQVATAGLALALGIMIYVWLRDPHHVYFLHHFDFLPGNPDSDPGIFVGQLPTFLHTFAFILFSIPCVSAGKSTARLICLSWAGIESLFEIGQHEIIAPGLVSFFPSWFEATPGLKLLEPFLVEGTFDPLDLLAIIFATALAYLAFLYSLKLDQPKKGDGGINL